MYAEAKRPSELCDLKVYSTTLASISVFTY